ncbi:MAG: type II toxin-antitoxin system Phd/YefM family antitoxin [Thermoleophilia bacterium]|nr:type II toxin-antitoxin system Phd/YefM family antitoxin [Thermoleophilia bacterium]
MILRCNAFMTIIMVMSETLPLADVKARLSELVERVASEHDRVLITRRGRPAAVLMSPDDLEALEETLDLLSEPDAMEEIRRAEADLDAGLGFSAADVRAKYVKR